MTITKSEFYQQTSSERQRTSRESASTSSRVNHDSLLNLLIEIMNFNEMVSTLIELLDSQAQKIEEAKLKAVGARNKIEGEEDNRRKRE
jgi:hypothetical protein